MILEQALELCNTFGPLSYPEDRITLYNMVLNTPPGAVVEVGSASGGMTIMLIGAAEEVNKQVISVDPYPEELEGKASNYDLKLMSILKGLFKKNILDGPWTNIVQYNENLSNCIDKIPDQISVGFIDSCHELSYVQNEILLLAPRVVPGGYLFIHDTNWPCGQISKTPETGLTHISKWMQTTPYTNTGVIKTMFYWQNNNDK